MDAKNSTRLVMIAKIAPYIIDFIVVIGTFGFGYLLFYVGIPGDNKDIMNMMFGTLIGLSVTIVNYHRGSSEGSAAKQATLDKVANKENSNGTT